MILQRRIEWPALLEWLNPQQGEKILDVACGSGDLTFKISMNGCEAHGLDVSSNIAYAQQLANLWGINCSFVTAAAEWLPYTDGCFNRVLCSSSLEHIEDDIGALKEMNRVLIRNGTLVLTVDSFSYSVDDEYKERQAQAYYVKHYYDKRKLSELFAQTGFEMMRSKYLMHSRAARYFFTKLIGRNYGFFSIMVALFAYPFVIIGDRLSDEDEGGFTLLAEGRKN